MCVFTCRKCPGQSVGTGQLKRRFVIFIGHRATEDRFAPRHRTRKTRVTKRFDLKCGLYRVHRCGGSDSPHKRQDESAGGPQCVEFRLLGRRGQHHLQAKSTDGNYSILCTNAFARDSLKVSINLQTEHDTEMELTSIDFSRRVAE